MPELTLTETVTVSQRDVTDEEKYLAHRYNLLVDTCITWAGQQMKYGTHPTRLSLTKSVLASAARLATLDTKTQTEQHRVAFQALLERMTEVEAYAATAPPSLGAAIDQDEESGD
jgi:hypothetical protein